MAVSHWLIPKSYYAESMFRFQDFGSPCLYYYHRLYKHLTFVMLPAPKALPSSNHVNSFGTCSRENRPPGVGGYCCYGCRYPTPQELCWRRLWGMSDLIHLSSLTNDLQQHPTPAGWAQRFNSYVVDQNNIVQPNIAQIVWDSQNQGTRFNITSTQPPNVAKDPTVYSYGPYTTDYKIVIYCSHKKTGSQSFDPSDPKHSYVSLFSSELSGCLTDSRQFRMRSPLAIRLLLV